MPITELNFDTLAELSNGSARLAIERELSKVVDDLEDRGDDEKPRKLCMELEIRKSSTGDDFVISTFKVQAKLPPLQTAGTAMKIGANRNGELALLFSTNAPYNPNQPSLLDDLDVIPHQPKAQGE